MAYLVSSDDVIYEQLLEVSHTHLALNTHKAISTAKIFSLQGVEISKGWLLLCVRLCLRERGSTSNFIFFPLHKVYFLKRLRKREREKNLF